MKNFVKKPWLVFLALLMALLVIAGCFDFEYVNQPHSAQPDSSFVVHISAYTTDGDGNSYVPYFGILLPVGWTVEDSIVFTCNSIDGAFAYSDSLSLEMGNIYPPPDNYYWWVGAGIDSVIYNDDDTYLFNPIIHTDSQTGNFYLSYMLGSSSQGQYGGLGYNISENRIITVGLSDHIVVTSPAVSGPGTLQQAIEDIDYYGTITFDLSPQDTILVESINIEKNISIIGSVEAPEVIKGVSITPVYTIINQPVTPYIANLIIANTSCYGSGAAFYCVSSSLKLENITICNCTASGSGGGISCDNSILDLRSVSFESNAAHHGGGLRSYYSDLSLTNVLFNNNLAEGGGGGMYLYRSTLSGSDLILTNNQGVQGGAMDMEMYSSVEIRNALFTNNEASHGGAIFSSRSNLDLSSATICTNLATYQGGAIRSYGSDIRVMNTIMWHNAYEQIVMASSDNNQIHISWSDIQGGLEEIVSPPGCQVYWLEGAINEPPYFSGAIGHPYSLSPASPLIDLGSPDTTGLNLPENDLLGNLRVWDGDENGEARIDMGAYEFASVPVGMLDFGFPISDFGFQIFPNPFRETTSICFKLDVAALVNVSVFNNLGQRVDVPVAGFFTAGEHLLPWNPGELPGGIYLCRLQAGMKQTTAKVIVNE